MKIGKANVRTEVTSTVTLEVTEAEVRALAGIFGYNVEAFLKAFYEKMGRAYVEPYEAGVRALHATVGALRPYLNEVDRQRLALRCALQAADPNRAHL